VRVHDCKDRGYVSAIVCLSASSCRQILIKFVGGVGMDVSSNNKWLDFGGDDRDHDEDLGILMEFLPWRHPPG